MNENHLTNSCHMYIALPFIKISATKKAIYDISAQQNRRRSESAQVRIGTGQNQHRPKSVVKIGTEKNEPMITHYIGNMIVFLRCHYTHLSFTTTSKLSVLNHNKILYYCNCHATISSSIHTFAIFFRKL